MSREARDDVFSFCLSLRRQPRELCRAPPENNEDEDRRQGSGGYVQVGCLLLNRLVPVGRRWSLSRRRRSRTSPFSFRGQKETRATFCFSREFHRRWYGVFRKKEKE